jgi:hypothetical protein
MSLPHITRKLSSEDTRSQKFSGIATYGKAILPQMTAQKNRQELGRDGKKMWVRK